mmetsp:Transcript_72714/g.187600  ORF Transcript_72714/g.187600 Transcript_72714/m.187600 type:complete len:206 (-) Transcript_72714:486-1103(-)
MPAVAARRDAVDDWHRRLRRERQLQADAPGSSPRAQAQGGSPRHQAGQLPPWGAKWEDHQALRFRHGECGASRRRAARRHLRHDAIHVARDSRQCGPRPEHGHLVLRRGGLCYDLWRLPLYAGTTLQPGDQVRDPLWRAHPDLQACLVRPAEAAGRRGGLRALDAAARAAGPQDRGRAAAMPLPEGRRRAREEVRQAVHLGQQPG